MDVEFITVSIPITLSCLISQVVSASDKYIMNIYRGNNLLDVIEVPFEPKVYRITNRRFLILFYNYNIDETYFNIYDFNDLSFKTIYVEDRKYEVYTEHPRKNGNFIIRSDQNPYYEYLHITNEEFVITLLNFEKYVADFYFTDNNILYAKTLSVFRNEKSKLYRADINEIDLNPPEWKLVDIDPIYVKKRLLAVIHDRYLFLAYYHQNKYITIYDMEDDTVSKLIIDITWDSIYISDIYYHDNIIFISFMDNHPSFIIIDNYVEFISFNNIDGYIKSLDYYGILVNNKNDISYYPFGGEGITFDSECIYSDAVYMSSDLAQKAYLNKIIEENIFNRNISKIISEY